MVLGQVLGQLEPREVLAGHDPAHDVRSFKDCKVPIDRALSEALALGQNLGDRERLGRSGDDLDDRTPLRCIALAVAAQPPGHLQMQLIYHPRQVYQ